MTVDLSLTIIANELMIPWLPIPLSLNPWNGKWSGPLEGAAFTCTVPVSMASLMRMAVLMLVVNKQPCTPQYCLSIACNSGHGAQPHASRSFNLGANSCVCHNKRPNDTVNSLA